MKADQSGGMRLKRAKEEEVRAGAVVGFEARPPEGARALAEIARSQHASLVRFLAVRTGSMEDAKEILQEAYAKLLALDRLGQIRLVGGYLWQTAMNLAIDRGRQKVLRYRYRRAALLAADWQEHSAESIVEARERLAIVERAIEELPPRCMEAFVLHVQDGLTFIEVGREMAISDRMAKKHVARALEYLQYCLDAAEETKGRPSSGVSGMQGGRG